MLPLLPEQEAKLQVSHTKQVENLISQIHKSTEKTSRSVLNPMETSHLLRAPHTTLSMLMINVLKN